MSPATDGPTSRAALNIDEFKAMAFARSSRSEIIVVRNAWRAGMSKAFTIPCTAFKATIAGTVMWPLNVRTASAKD